MKARAWAIGALAATVPAYLLLFIPYVEFSTAAVVLGLAGLTLAVASWANTWGEDDFPRETGWALMAAAALAFIFVAFWGSFFPS